MNSNWNTDLTGGADDEATAETPLALYDAYVISNGSVSAISEGFTVTKGVEANEFILSWDEAMPAENYRIDVEMNNEGYWTAPRVDRTPTSAKVFTYFKTGAAIASHIGVTVREFKVAE